MAGLGAAAVTQAHSAKLDHLRGAFHGMNIGAHGMGGGHHMGRHGARNMMRMFVSFDGNGDGALTQAEIDEARTARLAGFDTDGDGSLSLEEYQNLWLDAAREHMVDRFQNLDADGDGMVTKAEFSEPYSGMVKFMDRNGDGALNRDDMGRHGRMMEGASKNSLARF